MSGSIGNEDGSIQGNEDGSQLGVESTAVVPNQPTAPGTPLVGAGIQTEDGSGVLSETGVQTLQEADPVGPPPPPGPPTFVYFPPPPTRILSWLQLCLESDPSFRRLSQRPWIYQFSSGRLFVESLPVYGSTGLTDDFGTPIVDDFGNQIQSDTGGSTPSQPGTGFPFGEGSFGDTPF